jgi:hypothetical protein
MGRLLWLGTVASISGIGRQKSEIKDQRLDIADHKSAIP